mmetsp:Transcript_3379/g.8025  ORF Transcript_3379/g.8025 Transcript_3379/m.8025 type:complete len:459 (+) Transcript_3379:273-1649(+)
MREPYDPEPSEETQLQEGRTMKGDGVSPKHDNANIPGENSEFDFSCFEETEEDDALEQDLDPATFRQFVEDAAERMSSSGSLAGLTSSTSAHSLEGLGDLPSESRPLQLPGHTRLSYNQLVGQDAWLVISVIPPFSILAVSPAWTELFGFREQEIVGRSMRMVQGPQTNVRDLSEGIKKAAETAKSFQAAFMFYTKRMEARMMTIDVSPEHDDEDGEEGTVSHAVVTMDHSDWVPKKIAFAEDSRAKAVILADKPQSVVSISQQFSDMYQLQESMIVGRTMRAIFGPNTIERAFRQNVALAKTGKTQNLELRTCRADVSEVHVKMTLFPVMEAAAISHIMIVFKEVQNDEHQAGVSHDFPLGRRSSSAWLAGAPDPGSPTNKPQDKPMQPSPGEFQQHRVTIPRSAIPRMSELGDDCDVSSPVAGAKPAPREPTGSQQQRERPRTPPSHHEDRDERSS